MTRSHGAPAGAADAPNAGFNAALQRPVTTLEPDFLKQAHRVEDAADYDLWRTKAHKGELRVGSFVSMASQLPIFALRKRKGLLRKGVAIRIQRGGAAAPP